MSDFSTGDHLKFFKVVSKIYILHRGQKERIFTVIFKIVSTLITNEDRTKLVNLLTSKETLDQIEDPQPLISWYFPDKEHVETL